LNIKCESYWFREKKKSGVLGRKAGKGQIVTIFLRLFAIKGATSIPDDVVIKPSQAQSRILPNLQKWGNLNTISGDFQKTVDRPGCCGKFLREFPCDRVCCAWPEDRLRYRASFLGNSMGRRPSPEINRGMKMFLLCSRRNVGRICETPEAANAP